MHCEGKQRGEIPTTRGRPVSGCLLTSGPLDCGDSDTPAHHFPHHRIGMTSTTPSPTSTTSSPASSPFAPTISRTERVAVSQDGTLASDGSQSKATVVEGANCLGEQFFTFIPDAGAKWHGMKGVDMSSINHIAFDSVLIEESAALWVV